MWSSYEDNAESCCESAVNLALSICPSSLDAQQARANLLLSQSKPSDAADVMRVVGTRLLELYRILGERTVIDELAETPVALGDETEGNSYMCVFCDDS